MSVEADSGRAFSRVKQSEQFAFAARDYVVMYFFT
jgi:hypothetical protein